MTATLKTLPASAQTTLYPTVNANVFSTDVFDMASLDMVHGVWMTLQDFVL
jgi:hypothetical protein